MYSKSIGSHLLSFGRISCPGDGQAGGNPNVRFADQPPRAWSCSRNGDSSTPPSTERIGSQRSSKAPETLPVDGPRHTQVPANQNVGMISRLFVFDTKWIRIFPGHSTSLKEFSALIEVEAREDHGLRQPWVVSAIPEGIRQAHRMRQAHRGTVEIQSARFSIVPCENSGMLLLFHRQ